MRFVVPTSTSRAPEVRVHDDAGPVQHPAEPRRPQRRDLGCHRRTQIAGLCTGANLRPRALEHGARRVDGQGIDEPACQLVDGREVAELHGLF